MNRIIIIGNGFDRAHNLRTGYKEFIDDYWSDFITNTTALVSGTGNPYYIIKRTLCQQRTLYYIQTSWKYSF